MARGATRATSNGTARATGRDPRSSAKAVRVAIYTRQSVTREDAGEFGSIEAQREAVEAYVASQRGEGWTALPHGYNDGGFSGATTERPALKRLLEDVASGHVDVVAVYKLDRLSRSLVDFARLTALFEEHGASFVSITQSFNSATPMGKLTLNILMSFAEFEREQIAERTRDKMLATRRRGRWTGGRPPLGLDVVDGSLVINAEEAERVRMIFDLYLDFGSQTAVMAELRAREWVNKIWTTKNGTLAGGRPFDAPALRRLLANPLLAGKIRAGDDIVDAEHDAVVDAETWHAVQARLSANGGADARPHREPARWDVLLAGLATCARCGRPMGHSYTARRRKRYHAYVCGTVQKHGAAACPGGRVPAPELDAFVVSKIRAIANDAGVLANVAAAARGRLLERIPALRGEIEAAEVERENLLQRIRRAVGDEPTRADGDPTPISRRVAELEHEVHGVDRRLDGLRAELAALQDGAISPEDLRAVVRGFDEVWDELFPAERGRIVRLLVERVAYDPDRESVAITYRPDGPRALLADADRAAGSEETSP